MSTAIFIAESFDQRTLSNMEVALEQVCKSLPNGGDKHRSRRKIADKIVECAKRGDITLDRLNAAGWAAANELRSRKD